MSARRTAAGLGLACLLVAAPGYGQLERVDFEKLPNGERIPAGLIVNRVVSDRGSEVRVFGYNPNLRGFSGSAAVIFPSYEPRPWDLDLGSPNGKFRIDGTGVECVEGDSRFDCGPGRGQGGESGPCGNRRPLGNILIVDERLRNIEEVDESLAALAAGLVPDPDDERRPGAKLLLDFSDIGPVTIHDLTIIDVEEPDAEIRFYRQSVPFERVRDVGGTMALPADLEDTLAALVRVHTEDNGVAFLSDETLWGRPEADCHVSFDAASRAQELPISGVYMLGVAFLGSGGIDNVVFERPPRPPAIDIEKLTNGRQADLPGGDDVPAIAPGEPVTWTYEVRNTGPVPLGNIRVTDSAAGESVEVACPQSALEPGAAMTCVRTGLALDPGKGGYASGTCAGLPDRPLYANVARATGETEDGEPVEDSDPSHYCGPGPPDIWIAKQAKGPDVRIVERGSVSVVFTVSVANRGGADLRDLVVSDPQAPDCDRTFSRLRAGASTRYTCEMSIPAPAQGGCRFDNAISVTAMSPDGTSVQDSDTSAVEILGVAIEKTVQSVSSAGVTFEIVVRNTGCDVDKVAVTDPLSPDCARDLGAMKAGQEERYTCGAELRNEACAEAARGGGSVSACSTAAIDLAGYTGPGTGGEVGPGTGGEFGGGAPPPEGGDKKRLSRWWWLLLLLLLIAAVLFAKNRMQRG